MAMGVGPLLTGKAHGRKEHLQVGQSKGLKVTGRQSRPVTVTHKQTQLGLLTIIDRH